jgi:polyisoprenyl-phosphate glycosyltransferase
MYKLFYRVFAMFSYVNIPLDAGDFSLLSRRVVLSLLNCPERDLFVRGLRAYVGFKQIGVDYVRPERMFGTSTNNLMKNIEWAKKGIFSFSNAPLTMLTTIGVALLLLSASLVMLVIALKLFIPELIPQGITTLFLSILFFGSFNTFAIGLVGEYVSKIMIEVKERPRFIKSEIVKNGVITAITHV